MKIKSKYFFIVAFLILISFPIFIHLNRYISYYNNHLKADNIIGIENEDFPWGEIEIFNVTLNKTIIVIGEEILINASYKIILNFDWIIESIQFGIKSSDQDFIGIYLDQQQGNYIEVSRKIFYEPYDINLTESYYGYLEIIAKPIGGEPGEFVLINKQSDEEIDFQKAEIACDIIYRYPEITFYEEDTNISLKFTNRINKTYAFSNQNILIKLYGSSTSFEYPKTTDENGIVMVTLNTSELKTRTYDYYVKINTTAVYNFLDLKKNITIYKQNSYFNLTVNEEENLYVNVGNNDIFSKIHLEIKCSDLLNASIFLNYTSNYEEILNQSNNSYYKTFNTPNSSGIFQVEVIAMPQILRDPISIIKNFDIKKRPVDIIYNISRTTQNQRQVLFNISLYDKISEIILKFGNISTYYYDSNISDWSLIREIQIKDDNNLFYWSIPENYNYSNIKFKIELNNNPVYLSNSSIKDLILPLLKSFQNNLFYVSKNVTLRFKLEYFNGSALKNELIYIQIGNDNFSLYTNEEGFIEFYTLTSDKVGTITIKLLYPGSEQISPIYYECILVIEMNLSQKFLYYGGYIIGFFCLCTISVFTYKKIKVPKKVSDMKIK